MKRDAKVYLVAAERIAEYKNTYCCAAINAAADEFSISENRYFDLISAFKQMFSNGRGFYWGFYDSPANRSARVLALCFMAAMAEAGDL